DLDQDEGGEEGRDAEGEGAERAVRPARRRQVLDEDRLELDPGEEDEAAAGGERHPGGGDRGAAPQRAGGARRAGDDRIDRIGPALERTGDQAEREAGP